MYISRSYNLRAALVLGLTSLALLMTGAGCPSTTTSTNDSDNTNITNQAANINTNTNININTVDPNNNPKLGQNFGGPYSHEIHSASSKDGLVWLSDSSEPIAEHASVPAVIAQPDNTLMIYYVDASNGPDVLGCLKSTDEGQTFTKETCVIEDSAIDHAVDFAIVRLDTGKYRLYYFGSQGFAGDPASDKSDHNIYSAISDDGINFSEEGLVFAYQGLVDPDVFWNGETWVMHVHSLTENKTVVASSVSGTDFTFTGFLQPTGYGVTKPVTLADDTFRMYGFKQGQQVNFYSFTSTDGLTWTQETGSRLDAPDDYEITDPSVVQLSDDTYKMFYKLSPKLTNQPKP